MEPLPLSKLKDMPTQLGWMLIGNDVHEIAHTLLRHEHFMDTSEKSNFTCIQVCLPPITLLFVLGKFVHLI